MIVGFAMAPGGELGGTISGMDVDKAAVEAAADEEDESVVIDAGASMPPGSPMPTMRWERSKRSCSRMGWTTQVVEL
ncbi:MAG: hypothetical protein ACK5ZJ_07425 [Acidobacteriota bacterium]